MLSRYTIDATQYAEVDYPAYDARTDRNKEGILIYLGVSGGTYQSVSSGPDERNKLSELEEILGSIRIDASGGDSIEDIKQNYIRAQSEFSKAVHELSKRKLDEHEGQYGSVELLLDEGVYTVITKAGDQRKRPGGEANHTETMRTIFSDMAVSGFDEAKERIITVDRTRSSGCDERGR